MLLQRWRGIWESELVHVWTDTDVAKYPASRRVACPNAPKPKSPQPGPPPSPVQKMKGPSGLAARVGSGAAAAPGAKGAGWAVSTVEDPAEPRFPEIVLVSGWAGRGKANA